MSIESLLYLTPLFLASAASAVLAVHAWRQRHTPGAVPFMALVAALAGWGAFYALELAVSDPVVKIALNRVTFMGVVATPTSWFVFALEYTTGGTWLTRRRMAWLLVMPLLTIAMIFTNPWHHLFWVTREVVQVGPLLVLDSLNGAGFWAHALYSYALLLVGAVLIVRNILRWPRQYRNQIAAMLLALAAPWLANALTIFKLLPVVIDLTPFAFAISGVGLAYALFRQRMLDLVPVARDVIVDSMQDGMIVIDRDDRIVDINRQARAILGLAGERAAIGESLGVALADYRHLLDRFRDLDEVEDEIEIGRDQRTFWYRFTMTPLRDAQDQLIGKLLVARDITSRKQAELRLQESEARFRQIVENASDCILRTDAEGRFTYANPAALRTLGFMDESQVLGRHALELVAPGVRHNAKRTFQRQYLRRIANTYSEIPAITSAGSVIWLGQSSQLIMEGERIAGFQILARDITDIKRAQEALRLAHDQALAASRMKSQLLSRVSHELRTPLGGILGYAELMRDGAFGKIVPEQGKALMEIISSVDYLTEVVGELLDQAQIEAGMTILQVKRFSPHETFPQALSGMRVMAEGKGLRFEIAIDPHLPSGMLGDEGRLVQILINLIGNAIKFTPGGFVRVRIFMADDNHWAMQVSDSGIGISKQDQVNIFEPFHQLASGSEAQDRGIGLGLSIVKQLVDLMNGRILLESEPGQGATFEVVLPLVTAGDDLRSQAADRLQEPQ